jgi:hypothetical protein
VDGEATGEYTRGGFMNCTSPGIAVSRVSYICVWIAIFLMNDEQTCCRNKHVARFRLKLLTALK